MTLAQPGDDRPPKGGFNTVTPEFDVADLVASLAFWCDALGFTVAYARPESGFAYLERAGCQVMLCAINGNWQTGPLERPFGRGINIQITVETIAPLLSGLDAASWPLFREPHEVWYRVGPEEVGVRQFLVQDPDGYLIRFAGTLGCRSLSPGGPASSR